MKENNEHTNQEAGKQSAEQNAKLIKAMIEFHNLDQPAAATPVATFDSLISNHIERMWGGLEMSSVQHFMETGKVNGSFRLRLIDMLSQIVLDYEKEDQPKAAHVSSNAGNEADIKFSLAEIEKLCREAYTDARTNYHNVMVQDWWPEFKLHNNLQPERK